MQGSDIEKILKGLAGAEERKGGRRLSLSLSLKSKFSRVGHFWVSACGLDELLIVNF